LSGFTPGKTYSFAIRVRDEANNLGNISNSPEGTAGIDDIPPGRIDNLTVETSDDHGSVRLNWTAPGDDGDDVGTVHQYIVKYSTLPISNQVCFDYIEPEWTITIDGNLSAEEDESRIIPDFPPGERFYFAMIAVDDAGNKGEVSNCPSPAYVKNDITPPAAITDLTATTGLDHTEINLIWTAPGDDGDDGSADSYVIKYSNTPFTTVSEFDDSANIVIQSLTPFTAGTPEGIVIMAPTAGDTYYFAIVAKDETGQQGPLSLVPSVSAVSMDDTIFPGTIDDITAWPGPDHATLRLNWTAQGDDGAVGRATKYIIKYLDHLDPYINNETIVPTSDGQTSFFLEYGNLDTSSQNTLYYYNETIGGFKMNNTGPTQIGKYNYTIDNSTGEVALLDWSLNLTNDQIYAYYNVTNVYHCANTYKQSLVDTWTPKESGTAESYILRTVMGGFIDANTLYYFWVRAIDEAGNMGAIPTEASVTTTEDTTAPEAINDLAAYTGDNHKEIILIWTAPHEDGGSGDACDQYLIKWSATPIINDATFDNATQYYLEITPKSPGEEENHPLTPPVPPGSLIYFAIKAADERKLPGLGPLNTPLPVPASSCNDTTPPSAINDLTAFTADGNGEITLNWTTPGDDDTSGTPNEYIIKYREAISEYRKVAFERIQKGIINPTFEDIWYNVTGIPRNVTEIPSNYIYRLGIHPDPNLA
ncbi:MAG: hypothetical protein KAX31_03435, partial [Thermoplasmata archaeon]|nr:hypothetical protein [Thermoplasmata archaeon]